MKKFQLFNNITGWLVFVVSAFVYILTVEPTASFWDCGEFITTAYKLEVGHPPGAPLFMILGRIASLFAFGDVTKVALMINTMSAVASAFTIMFLFWTITHIGRKIVAKKDEDQTNFSPAQIIAIIGSGLVGALAYTFSDTFWFSAVEGEVYASSSLFTAVVFWAILKWENEANERYANRWIILIAYLVGLSIGVHLLNLLAIPAMVMVFYFRKYKPTKIGILYASLAAVAILGSVMYGIVPGIVTVASKFELFFVNTLHLGFNTGILAYSILLIGVIVAGIYFTLTNDSPVINTVFASLSLIMLGIPFFSSNGLITIIVLGGLVYGVYRMAIFNRALVNTILTAFTVIVIGYSSFAMIVIRSLAEPPMDQNDPEDVFSLLSYLNREQYGENPLITGQFFNAPVVGYDDGAPVYVQQGDKYVVIDHKLIREFAPGYSTFFPRMYSDQDNHIEGYMKWTGINESELFYPRLDASGNQVVNPRTGQPMYDYEKPKRAPSFAENLRYFFKYQLNYMYLRYFLWNFVGRQNDIQGHGEVMNGNWISGISFIDNARLGSQDLLPDYLKNNKGRNVYFFLPLIIGILGVIFNFRKNKKDFWVLLLFFFFTGIAIILYTNQPPYQPRERDYAYAGSFYVFAIWIGLGVLGIIQFLRNLIDPKGENHSKYFAIATGITVVTFAAAPLLMASQNWDDHDRSERYTARDFAYNYLNSCAPNAIIFTNGDNDTFPLWYAQEVEGIRTDIRVINLAYLGTDWYISQMKRKAYDSEPVPFSLTEEQYAEDKRNAVYIQNEINSYTNLKEVIEFIKSDDVRTKLQMQSGEMFDYSPTSMFMLPIDSADVMQKAVVPQNLADKVLKEMQWKLNRPYIRKNDLMVLDLLVNNNWERPIYFAITVGSESYLDLENFFRLEGLAYRVAPVFEQNSTGQLGGVNTEIMYDNMMNKFHWGGIDNPNVYLDENNQRMLMNMRNNFYRLADALITEGKNDKAIEVLDRCIELMPHERVPFNYYNLLIANGYYMAGATEKANSVIGVVAEVSFQELEYFLSLPESKAISVETDMQRSASIMQEIFRQLQIYKQDDIFNQLNTRFENLLSKYSI